MKPWEHARLKTEVKRATWTHQLERIIETDAKRRQRAKELLDGLNLITNQVYIKSAGKTETYGLINKAISRFLAGEE